MKTTELLAACFVFFTLLLVWPLLGIPNRRALVGGVPGMVLYLFGVWAVIVAVLAWTAHRAGPDDAP